MSELLFSFEDAPWETYLDGIRGSASAATLLTLTEGDGGDALEEALEMLEARELSLDITDLPKPSASGEAALRLRQEESLIAKGWDVASLEEGDPLRIYIEDVAMTPAFGDEQLLAEKCRTGDESAMVALTNLSLSRVVAAAGEFTGRGVLLLDLIQEGSMGLWKAVRTWEEGDFLSYSDRWIRFYLAKAVTVQARSDGIGQKMRIALEDYRSVDERLLAELGRNPTLDEIAEAMHTTPENAAYISKMVENARLVALAKKQPEPEEEEIAETQAVEDTAYFQMRQRISELLSGLHEEDAKLISLRYGLEGGLPLSPAETGRKLGLTPEEVVAREAAALSALRNH